MAQERPIPTILEILSETQKTLLRLQRLAALHQLIRLRKQLEMQGVDTSKVFTPEAIAALGENDA